MASGIGFVPVESRKKDKQDIGLIAIDALFSPIRKVNFEVENMRVGERTDYNRLKIEIETDGSITPSEALHKAGSILKDHFEKIQAIEVTPTETLSTEKKKKSTKKK